MPPIGFLITVLQTPQLRYVISSYVEMGVLLLAIIARLQTRPVSRRTFLLILLASILTASFTGIEWLHFLAGRKTIDGLTDLRMIVYSSFYGSIIIFVLYSMYLTTLGEGQKKSHLGFVIKFLSGFHIAFVGYWLLLYFGWVEPIPRADLLHSNSISYEALFVLCVLLLYRDVLELNSSLYRLFIAVNTMVIFLNQTRGAILGLPFVVCYCLVKSVRDARRAILYCVLLGSLSGIVALAALTSDCLLGHVLGKNAGSLEVVLQQVFDAYERGESSVAVNPGIINDESSISAFSRIGSNYYSFLSFLDKPLLGIGQAESYSIKVFGGGVHSLHFLLANSTGILGMLLFAGVMAAIVSAQGSIMVSRRFALVFFLFFGYALVFNNSMPIYFSLIVTLLVSQCQAWHPVAHCPACEPEQDERERSTVLNGNESWQL